MGARCLLGVQRVEERGSHEVYGPDHRGWSHEDAFANTTNREAN